MLRSPESEMTHFNWSPGIGDPTVAGWLTVILYLVTSISFAVIVGVDSLGYQTLAQIAE